MSQAPAVTGLAVGVGFLIILSISIAGLYPKPPDLFLIVEGKRFKAGYGSYGGVQWDGRSFGADVDSSRTLPGAIINVTKGSEIQFFSPGHVMPVYSRAWILDRKSHSQYYLEKVSDNTFKIPNDVPESDYIITVLAQYREGMITSSYYNHKIHVLHS